MSTDADLSQRQHREVIEAAVHKNILEVAGNELDSGDLPTDDAQRLLDCLTTAATIWHNAVGHDGLSDRLNGYSTTANRFLYLAERASLAALYCLPDEPDESEPEPPREGCYLYRLWTDTDRLLYVGVSTNLRSRLRSHRRRWPDLWETATWEEHPDETSMLAAEKEAIANELPALNRAGIT